MKVRNRIVNYLRGDRRGKEANGLERDALNDAFLYEALEGLTETRRDVGRDIEWLSRQLRMRLRKRWRIGGKSWGMVAAFVVVGFGIWLLVQHFLFFREEPQKTLILSGIDTAGGNVEACADENVIMPLSVVTGQQENGRNPDTVLVQRKSALRCLAVSGKGDTFIKENQGSVPFGGYENFYRYIRDSLRYPLDALEQGLEGDIKLSFYVNKAGRPSRIRVVKWITYSCNREAIRLLCEGPAWNYTGDTSYVVIPFRLKK